MERGWTESRYLSNDTPNVKQENELILHILCIRRPKLLKNVFNWLNSSSSFND